MLTRRRFLLTLSSVASASLLPAIAAPAAPKAQPKTETLDDRMTRVIARTRARKLNSRDHTPWVIMHGVIAFERDLVVTDVERGKQVNAIRYLGEYAAFDGKRIFRDDHGTPTVPTRYLSYGLKESFKIQDHVDQYLMAFADADVPLSTPIVAEGGRRFAVSEMLSAAQSNFHNKQELGWTLVALSHYLPRGQRWTTKRGDSYTVEDVVNLATKRDVANETEGGAHHLYGVSFALNRHQEGGGALSGGWSKARKYLDRHIALAKKHQLPDGHFSVSMTRGSKRGKTPRQRVWATGHTLEWLSVALNDQEIRQKWVARAVEVLVSELERAKPEALSDGGLYHAVHALRRYRERLHPVAANSRP